MSQQQVGQVYSRIIDQVCDVSQIDFEEGGVDSDTLKLLKQRWQKKLSALEVGHFPWDPQPQTSTTTVNPSPTPPPQVTSKASNAPKITQQAASANGRPSPAPPSKLGPRVKADHPQYHPTGPPTMGYPTPQMSQVPSEAPNMLARQRAAKELHSLHDPRAAALAGQLQQPHNVRPPVGLRGPEDPGNEDGKPILANSSSPVPPSHTPLRSAQQDGADGSLTEWKTEVARRRAMAAEAPGRGQHLFRDYMLHRQQQIEGGGLLLPLQDRQVSSARTKRRVEALLDVDEDSHTLRGLRLASSSLPQSQADAQADDEEDAKELDEDAINSDLDDSDDAGGDPEDETVEQVMLCTYDKVQRTKNKWKCLMKDGILRVGNKEYVFNKGHGEFEW